jgi:hypothetical protein
LLVDSSIYTWVLIIISSLKPQHNLYTISPSFFKDKEKFHERKRDNSMLNKMFTFFLQSPPVKDPKELLYPLHAGILTENNCLFLTSCQGPYNIKLIYIAKEAHMQTLTTGELKTSFSEVLKKLRSGQKIVISYGK